jgi:hypothetical protein
LKKIRFDVRSIIVCLSVHFFLIWVSNGEFLMTTIHNVNSMEQYWNYQALLVVFYMVYLCCLVVFSGVLKKIERPKMRYALLLTSIILPIPYTIRSGTFTSKLMSATNTVGKWYGIKIYRYFLWVLCIWIILSVIFFAVDLIRKSLKKRRKANEIL